VIDTGFDFDQITIEELPQAFRLAKVLMDTFHPTSVSDVGCATGLYLVPFVAKGIPVYGYELNEEARTRSLLRPEDVWYGDITASPFEPPVTDISLCIEVMEHIPEADANTAINHLCLTSDIIIFSAAAPGQGGVGHINCQPKAYWVDKFRNNNFFLAPFAANSIIDYMVQGYHMGWLRQNLMVLRRNK
jgi:hypothetical protein